MFTIRRIGPAAHILAWFVALLPMTALSDVRLGRFALTTTRRCLRSQRPLRPVTHGTSELTQVEAMYLLHFEWAAYSASGLHP